MLEHQYWLLQIVRPSSELIPNFPDLFIRQRPIRVARVAMKQRSGLHRPLELFSGEADGLNVVIGADYIEVELAAHSASSEQFGGHLPPLALIKGSIK